MDLLTDSLTRQDPYEAMCEIVHERRMRRLTRIIAMCVGFAGALALAWLLTR